MGIFVTSSASVEVQTDQAVPDPISILVSRAKNGDREAFASLYELYKGKVYSTCLRMTRNVAEAEDLTQKAFMQAFRKLATFRGDSLFSTWLYRVALNTVLMAIRRKGLPQVSLDEPVSKDSSCTEPQVRHDDLYLLGAVDRLALASAIRELPPSCRMMFLLHEVEGYEHP